MATRRIFLHIGAIKTGTTYIQTVLRENRERLIEEGVLFPGRALAQPGACGRGRAPAQQEAGRAAHAHPSTLARPGRGDPVLRRRHGGRVHGVALVRAPGSGAVDRVVAGPRRGPGGAHAPGRDGARCRRSGRPACTTDRRSRGPGSPVGSEPRRASRRPRRGTRRWEDTDVRPHPGRPLHPAVLGGAAGSGAGRRGHGACRGGAAAALVGAVRVGDRDPSGAVPAAGVTGQHVPGTGVDRAAPAGERARQAPRPRSTTRPPSRSSSRCGSCPFVAPASRPSGWIGPPTGPPCGGTS